MTDPSLLALTVAQGAAGVVVPWWMRLGLIAAGMLALAAIIALTQARHRPARAVTWTVLIFCVPILGPLAYFVVETVRYRRDHPRRRRGRAERSVTEEHDDGDQAAGGPHRR